MVRGKVMTLIKMKYGDIDYKKCNSAGTVKREKSMMYNFFFFLIILINKYFIFF